MGKEPNIRLYSESLCVSDRPEVAAITGKRVAIIGRFQDNNGEWSYTVYESLHKTSPIFTCFETELVPVAPIPFVSDSEHLANIVTQTAGLRYAVGSAGLRKLLQDRGYDPRKCLQISCNQGDDVNITLVLPDGTVVNADYREHRETRQALHFVEWEVQDYSDRELELCREIVSRPDTSEFDAKVHHYFQEHLAATDRPLPPLREPPR